RAPRKVPRKVRPAMGPVTRRDSELGSGRRWVAGEHSPGSPVPDTPWLSVVHGAWLAAVPTSALPLPTNAAAWTPPYGRPLAAESDEEEGSRLTLPFLPSRSAVAC